VVLRRLVYRYLHHGSLLECNASSFLRRNHLDPADRISDHKWRITHKLQISLIMKIHLIIMAEKV
jgi:hypothetical protein